MDLCVLDAGRFQETPPVEDMVFAGAAHSKFHLGSVCISGLVYCLHDVTLWCAVWYCVRALGCVMVSERRAFGGCLGAKRR